MAPLPPLAADTASSAAAGDAPVVALVNEILKAAAARDASDIHIEPAEHGWRVRLRIDGALHPFAAPPAHLRDGVVTRLKVLSRLDIAERRVPQDGRLRIALAPGLTGDYRVSSLPTLHGEKLVLRRLDTLPADLSLSSLGFDARQAGALEAAVAAPHGLVLVTGPTGSGKTVTLYCCLQGLNLASRNLCTIEDPAELQLDGLNQVNVRDKAGLSFAVALRAFLRQDPDVIMVGEIRDAETADVALKAAQTGHLVLSTLHTNDAPGAIARLLDIGVAPYHIAAALRIVTAQRLVRRLCVACRQPSRESIPALLASGLDPARLEGGWRPFVSAGCEACHGIGYRGRTGVHQVMVVTDALRERIVARAGSLALTRQAQADGMRSLREAALARVHDGSTSLDEACAVAEAG
ncbi:type II secretion system protein E [Burkholderia gladioli]|nr:type II secretion system protein E [Burkholderia gladioli]